MQCPLALRSDLVQDAQQCFESAKLAFLSRMPARCGLTAAWRAGVMASGKQNSRRSPSQGRAAKTSE